MIPIPPELKPHETVESWAWTIRIPIMVAVIAAATYGLLEVWR